MDGVENNGNIIEKILGDVGKTSAAKQLIIGSSSGWCTGFIGMKVGKVAAVAVGGGIILLQIANHNGYININWNKINKKIDKISDKVEEKVSGQGPSWMNKVERFVDHKIDDAEDLLKNRQKKAKSWFQTVSGNSDFAVREIHIFFVSFLAGMAVGVACG
ncbi:uncharacterized protein CBL_13350 [Carabus blaptoides fortunei]